MINKHDAERDNVVVGFWRRKIDGAVTRIESSPGFTSTAIARVRESVADG